MMRGTEEEIAALKIGDVLYNFDSNRRVYRDRSFSGGGGPIYAEHFTPVEIVGETKNSWVLARYAAKVNKKTLESARAHAERGYFTKSAMADDIWLNERRHKIAEAVRYCDNVNILKTIDRMLEANPTNLADGRGIEA
jgi:hypothetical protein